MERYFILGDFNTWYDWRLVLTSKAITPPEPKTNYIELDGMSGTLDLSESLTGETTYKDRVITATFWTDEGTRKDREKLLRDIVISLHGKKVKIIEPDDPTHYFIGRVTVKSSQNILPYLEFTLEMTCGPWRYAIDETSRSITLNNQTVNIVIWNDGAKTICPTIKVSDNYVRIGFGGITELVNPTDSIKLPDLKLRHGNNVINIDSPNNSTITFTYREADL